MKITETERAAIAAAVLPFDTEPVRARYRAGDYPRADRTRNVDERYRWDLLWAAIDSGAIRYGDAFGDGRYTMAHVDTVLRRIVAPLWTV